MKSLPAVLGVLDCSLQWVMAQGEARVYRLVPTHPWLRSTAAAVGTQGCPTYIDVGNLFPVMVVQPVSQQSFLWELAEGKDKQLVSCKACSSPLDPESPSLLDVLNLLLCFLNLLLQGLPVHLARDSALFLM